MTPGWAVVWQGETTTTFLAEGDAWSLDPDEAFFFKSWFAAQFAVGVRRGCQIVRCWI